MAKVIPDFEGFITKSLHKSFKAAVNKEDLAAELEGKSFNVDDIEYTVTKLVKVAITMDDDVETGLSVEITMKVTGDDGSKGTYTYRNNDGEIETV
jgi:hypothetical protein